MKRIFLILLVSLFVTSCYKKDVPPITISFLSQTQVDYWQDSCSVPGEILVDYYIYNNTMNYIDYCQVEFIIFYEDSTYEISKPDLTTGIRDHQRNDIIIDTDKKFSHIDVYSVLINGNGCKYNIIN